MEESAIEGLEAKSPEEAIVEQISWDFNLAPFMAKTQSGEGCPYLATYLNPNVRHEGPHPLNHCHADAVRSPL